ncbi:C39 family peptidase [Herbaspirillum huttiense]|uniref:C39 family peptidase n=1 Tax=Herbaspirillum huttiense TaxID=863372 RepID=UPI002E796ED5|nr:papain-like cysteine protease family protein [Herbaspirillum huttiense]MEE1636922.1 papain-like cysteine protease family protein [Herbaspirillum huttiense NC40101]
MNLDKSGVTGQKFLFALVLCILIAKDAYSIEIQERSNWCWVASVQDVLAQVGSYSTQTQVATRLLGAPYDQPANSLQVASLLNSYGLKAWKVEVPASPQQLQSTLNSGWRIIALARPTSNPVGHFIVLQAADNYGKVVISDPANGQTYISTVSQLYAQWHWLESVVVGNPKPNKNYASYNGISPKIDPSESNDDDDEHVQNNTTPHSFKVPEWMK